MRGEREPSDQVAVAGDEAVVIVVVSGSVSALSIVAHPEYIRRPKVFVSASYCRET